MTTSDLAAGWGCRSRLAVAAAGPGRRMGRPDRRETAPTSHAAATRTPTIRGPAREVGRLEMEVVARRAVAPLARAVGLRSRRPGLSTIAHAGMRAGAQGKGLAYWQGGNRSPRCGALEVQGAVPDPGALPNPRPILYNQRSCAWIHAQARAFIKSHDRNGIVWPRVRRARCTGNPRAAFRRYGAPARRGHHAARTPVCAGPRRTAPSRAVPRQARPRQDGPRPRRGRRKPRPTPAVPAPRDAATRRARRSRRRGWRSATRGGRGSGGPRCPRRWSRRAGRRGSCRPG